MVELWYCGRGISSSTSSFLPLIFHPPEALISIHICVYLPTYGRENEFLHELTNLSETLDVLRDEYPNSPIFIRGDFNVNDKNVKRKSLLDSFIIDQNLTEVA